VIQSFPHRLVLGPILSDLVISVVLGLVFLVVFQHRRSRLVAFLATAIAIAVDWARYLDSLTAYERELALVYHGALLLLSGFATYVILRNIFRQRAVIGLAVRRVRSEVPTFEELRLPDVMPALADSPRGLVLVTGPTGTGKTTTIAAMIGHINRTRRAHIVTIEDPIEVMHDDMLSIVQQREIGIDTDSYANALRHVIRQDPDVIFVGEIRDGDSAMSAIQAAETGHLVISTLHTIDCMETINRILDLFPPHQQKEVRTSFAGSLRGIVSQRLVAKADGKGRVPAVEVLINTGRVFDRIVDPATTDQIVDVIAEGDFYGMQTFDQSLVQLTKEGLVTEDEARRAASNPHDFDLMMRGVLDRLSVGDGEGLPF
jgi:twitching motility protein PilT